MKRLAIFHFVWWMLMGYEFVYCASLKDVERNIVKRDLELIQGLASGAIDSAIDFFEKFAGPPIMNFKSETGGFGIQHNNEFKIGGDSPSEEFSNEREKRSPGSGCGKRNETATTNNSTNNSTVTTRGTRNPDVETLARRKRSPQETNDKRLPGPNGPPSNGVPTNRKGQNEESSNDEVARESKVPRGEKTLVREVRSPCNNLTAESNTNSRVKRSPQGPPSNGSPPSNGLPPPPPNGQPPPNGPRPNGPPPNHSPQNGETPNEASENRESPNGATENDDKQGPPDLRTNMEASNEDYQNNDKVEGRQKRSPQGHERNGDRNQRERENQNNNFDGYGPSESQNLRNNNRNLNGYGSSEAQNWQNDNKNLNGYGPSEGQNWQNDNRNLNGYGPSEAQNLQNDNRNLNGYGTNEGQNWQNDNRNLNGYGPTQGQNSQNGYGEGRIGNTNSGRKKRSPKPCDGNGQPTGTGFPTNINGLPSQQFPLQQQQLPNGGINIGNLQRDQQNQRVRRGVQDPDKVLPVTAGNGDDKNLFERLADIIKEIAVETMKRVARWTNENEKELDLDTKSTLNAKDKPKL